MTKLGRHTQHKKNFNEQKMPVATTPAPVVNGNHEQLPEQMNEFGQMAGEDYEFRFVKKLDDDDIKLETSDSEKSPKKAMPDPAEIFETVETHADKQLKLNDGKPKKIRRMTLDDLDEKRRQCHETKKKLPLLKWFLCLALVGAVGYFMLGNEVCDDLFRHYRKEYNIAMQGKEYCTDDVDYIAVGKILHDNIVGQKTAIGQIQEALRIHKDFTSIVLHGPTGTGKTLTTQILASKFRWQENTQILVYNPNAKFDLASITRRMSPCGHNLVIIDDLHLINRDLLNIRQDLEAIAKTKNYRVILIFVFNMSKFQTQKDVDGEGPIFEHLPPNQYNIVEYRRMNDIDLDECMNKVEKELAVTLSHTQRADVKKSVDVTKNGCKNVRSKVSLYS